MCYTLLWRDLLKSQSMLPLNEHYNRMFNITKMNNQTSYHIHPKHKFKLNDTHKPPAFQYHTAYPRNYRFIINHKDACTTMNPFLVLMVPVAPHNMAARDAIRKTWGSEKVVQGEKVLTLFVLGLPSKDINGLQEEVRQENLQYDDLIQSNFIDSYINLTIKTMVIMDWLATHCRIAAYGMKIDSDMFLNIDNLIIMLHKPGIPKVNYLTGRIARDRPVVRANDSKWYVPKEMYPDETYPPYTVGMGYLFSNDLPEKFVEISKMIPPFNIEDAYIGMCMKQLGLRITTPPKYPKFRRFKTRFNRCKFSKVLTYILQTSEDLVRFWRELKKPGPPC
ncbi:beta-1,3-galactosyltransferase 2-like [Thalassophryne amazonica]|uniref:beta-1,3-galactosyltransferase 2-like n=1 Tax=Thalassophryne amazonica TaxID=390379 RepID=UPI0014716C4A|nr:beta-1,3-galactosyltransferase 2-like [Thalassophryne amazonica]